MKKQIRFLRIAYWVGAVLDGIMLFPMLSIKIAGKMFGIPNFNPGQEYRYAMFMGAALMLGWTILLIWAARKPIERREIILITAIPVIVGMVLANIYAVCSGLIKIENMLLSWILQALLFILYIFVYIYSFLHFKD